MASDDITTITANIFKAIKDSQFGAVQFTDVPEELLVGEAIHLKNWSLLLTDENLETICEKSKTAEQHYFLDGSTPHVREMFNTFWTPRVASLGLLKLNIAAAKDVTDYGMMCVTRSCRELRELDISGCTGIGDAGIRELGMNCSNLSKLIMKSCLSVEGSGFVAIAECCPQLSYLDISQCRKLQRWSINKLFGACRKLEYVNISHLQLVGDDEIRVLASFNSHLTSLIATEALNVSDTGILALTQHCFDLDVLAVSRKSMVGRITDVSLLALSERSLSLRELYASGCDHISDVGLTWLSEGCKALEVIDLGGCTKITDAGLRSIGNACHSLLHINISNAKLVSDVGVASIATGCAKLKSMNCHGLYLLADPRISAPKGKKLEPWQVSIGVAALAQKCPELESLDVSGCFRLNTSFEKHLSLGLRHIKKLNIAGCYQVESNSLVTVAEHCFELEEVNVSDCGKGINAAVFQALAHYCARMKTIEAQRCDNLRGAAIQAIASFPDLEKLDISGCENIQDSSLLPICEVDKLPILRSLYICDIPKVTDAALAWISNGCPSLYLLSFKGTKISRASARAVRDNFPYSDMLYNTNFAGFWPKSRLKDKILVNAYYKVRVGIVKLQGRVRIMLAKRTVAHLVMLRDMQYAASKIQTLFMMNKAKKEVERMRQETRKLNYFAVKVIAMMRGMIARHRVNKKREEARLKVHTYFARKIQDAWRAYRSRLTTFRMQAAFLEVVRKRREAALVLQSAARMFKSKRQMYILKEYIMSQMRVKKRKALLIQRVYRGYAARVYVHMLREHLEAERAHKVAAVTKIQIRYRNYRTNSVLRLAVYYSRRRNKSAIKIQAAIRAKLARLRVEEIRVLIDEERFERASVKIQTRWRIKHAMLFVAELLRQMRLAEQQKTVAATIFSKHYRALKARQLLWQLKFERDEAIRLRVQTEFWAAVKIQSVFRGMLGRLRFDAKLREKKGKWKELMDEETGKRFFYNKLTGEIRWRMPQDLLDLIPRPKCDNCLFYEASIECGVCNEFYCQTCWSQVHYGGRRKDHEFRSLYDYYNKRIDYGDGVFPCKWPSEVMQDDVQGWMLRVAPIRPPVAVYGDWEQYHADLEQTVGSESATGGTFYFNRKTFEASYEMPYELQQASTQGSPMTNYGDSRFTFDFNDSMRSTQYSETVQPYESGMLNSQYYG